MKPSMSPWVIFATLLASPTGAQAPLSLEHREGAPFRMLPYNYTEFAVDFEARHYTLVYLNESPQPSEIWITYEGSMRHHSTLEYDGGIRIGLRENGTHKVQVNGKGMIAFVLPQLLDESGLRTVYHNATILDRVGYAAMRMSAADHVCIDAGQPFTAEIYGGKFNFLKRHENVTRVRDVYDTTWEFVLVFIEVDSEGWVRTTNSLDPCPETPDVNRAAAPESSQTPTWGIESVLVLAALGLRFRRRGRTR